MIHLVGILVAGITCVDIAEKLDRADRHPDLTPQQKAEIVELYKTHLTEAVGLTCDWDAND